MEKQPKLIRDIIIFVAIMVVLLIITPRQLDAPPIDDAAKTISFLPDGSGKITESVIQLDSNTNTGSKTYTFLDFFSSEYGTIRWQIRLIGTFEPSDDSYICTNANCEVYIYNTLYTYSKKDITCSFDANTASCAATVSERIFGFPISTTTQELTLTCSPDGTLS